MSNVSTANEVRLIAEALTGTKITGPVERQTNSSEEAYRICCDDGDYFCLRHGAGWIVYLLDRNEKPLFAWSNVQPKDDPGATVINLFLHRDAFYCPDGPSWNPVFLKSSLDFNSKIQRKFYSTDLGTVIVHFRPRPNDTEIVLEAVGPTTAFGTKMLSIIIRCVREDRTGQIDKHSIQLLKAVPF
jgi:hypothetical protein